MARVTTNIRLNMANDTLTTDISTAFVGTPRATNTSIFVDIGASYTMTIQGNNFFATQLQDQVSINSISFDNVREGDFLRVDDINQTTTLAQLSSSLELPYIFSGNDKITGSAENDVLKGYTGNDTIDGGAGIDRVMFTGGSDYYTIMEEGDSVIVFNEAQGRDSLTNIEFLQFEDRIIDVDQLFAAPPVATPAPVPTSSVTFDLFDDVFYLNSNPDVAAAGVDASQHFQEYGWREGRDPSAAFDVSFYLENYADVAAAGINPLQHFQEYGWREGRDPSAAFDVSFYLENYADVAAAGINPLQHFQEYGWREGRDPSAAFDVSAYLESYRDVAAANVNPLLHYLEYGIEEGRLVDISDLA